MSYDYKKSKENILNVLTSKTKIEKRNIPKNEDEFTYENGVKSWIGAIFIDIVDSTSLFKNQKEDIISRVIRSFSSEIIDILKNNDKLRKLGLRGDSVYAVYSAEYKSDLVSIFRLAYQINTFMIMFNKLLENNHFPTITAGIGLGASEDLVIKAGKKRSGYNDLIFIGNAVVDASNLSGEANRRSIGGIAMNSVFYSNIIDELKKENTNYETWIKPKYASSYGYNSAIQFYHCDIIQTDFDKWIKDGMK
ncbi:MAG: adenylate cyclase [Bacilli bacterium]|nr:adenylate cyclase [Bacilli bacterium]